MRRFSQFFEDSDTEFISVEELFKLFQKIVGIPALTRQEWTSRFQPAKYFNRRIRRVRCGKRCRKEQVIYMVKQKTHETGSLD